MTKARKHGTLEGATPFTSKNHRVMRGVPQTHLKPGEVKRKQSKMHINSSIHTGIVKGPLTVSAKRHARKRTTTKA